jgi:DNA-binding LacI/PurR family transcriptional regulator
MDAAEIKPARVTASHVAKACGLSQPTVSQILSGSALGSRYSEATRERVLAAARDLGYRVNVAARSMWSGRFGVISLLLSTKDGRSTLPSGLLRGLQDQLHPRKLRLQVSMLPDDQLIAAWGIPDALTQAHSDGLLINYTHEIPAALGQAIEQNHLPAVWINSDRGDHRVRPDDEAGAYLATRHLLELGHRRIAYSDFSHGRAFAMPHYSVGARERGHARAMAEAGLSTRVMRVDEVDAGANRVTLAADWLRRPDRPSAVLCYGSNDSTPWSVAGMQVGLSVPRDLSLVHFAGGITEFLGVWMTTVVVPEQQVGETAVEMLVARLAGEHLPVVHRKIPMALEVRGSTAACR